MARKTNPILDSYGMLSPRPLSPRERLAGLLSDTMGAGRNGYQGIMGLLGQSYDQTPEAQARDALNPVGGLLSGYDSGRDAAGQFLQGRYASGLGTLGLAVVPLPVAAKTPVKRAALEANSILHRAVAATKGAEIIPEGLKMRVGRGQLPSQEMEQSVRGGVFYLPEGSSNARHYIGRARQSRAGIIMVALNKFQARRYSKIRLWRRALLAARLLKRPMTALSVKVPMTRCVKTPCRLSVSILTSPCGKRRQSGSFLSTLQNSPVMLSTS
jgi:hypothetical protein